MFRWCPKLILLGVLCGMVALSVDAEARRFFRYRPHYSFYNPLITSFFKYPVDNFGHKFAKVPIFRGFNFGDYSNLFIPEPNDFRFGFGYGRGFRNPFGFGFNSFNRFNGFNSPFRNQFASDPIFSRPVLDFLESKFDHNNHENWFEVLKNGRKNPVFIDAATGQITGFRDPQSIRVLFDHFHSKYLDWIRTGVRKPSFEEQAFLLRYHNRFGYAKPKFIDYQPRFGFGRGRARFSH